MRPGVMANELGYHEDGSLTLSPEAAKALGVVIESRLWMYTHEQICKDKLELLAKALEDQGLHYAAMT